MTATTASARFRRQWLLASLLLLTGVGFRKEWCDKVHSFAF